MMKKREVCVCGLLEAPAALLPEEEPPILIE
jgi:hypothetical protein